MKRPDTPLVKGVFERAVKDHPTNIEVWEAYLEFLVRSLSACSADRLLKPGRTQHKIPEKESNLREVAEKAVRNLPSSVSLWTAYFRVVVRLFISRRYSHADALSSTGKAPPRRRGGRDALPACSGDWLL